MRSPFPGMDPYLESSGLWRDFHQSFITYWRDALADRLPENYEARIDEHVRLVEVELDEEQIRRVRPDVAIERRGASSGTAPRGAAATLEPVTLALMTSTEEVRESWIEIFRRPEQKLVAVLELLSPTNKSDPGRGDYLAKRNSLIRQRVHLVEVDLLIGGWRMPLSGALPPGDYYAMVARSDRRPDVEVYAWTVRQALPTIPIPLEAPDPDVGSDLGEVFAMAYERGRYARSLDYGKPPGVGLAGEDLAWAAERGQSSRR